MHNQNYRYRSPIGGFFAFMFFFIGLIVFVGFITGIFRYIFWPGPIFGTVILLMIFFGFYNSARRRAYYRRVQRQQRVRYQQYRPTENPFWKNQEKHVVQEREPEPVVRIDNSIHFCDYCGMKLNDKMSYCTNCGNKLQ